MASGPGKTKRPTTARKQAIFLRHFSETLNVTESAKAAGLHRASIYRLVERDPRFAERYEEAKRAAIDRLEAAAYRFATEGAVETTYDGEGNVVSRRVREDPTSAARLLAAHRPAVYSEKYRLEVAGQVDHEHAVEVRHEARLTLADVMALARELEQEGSLPALPAGPEPEDGELEGES